MMSEDERFGRRISGNHHTQQPAACFSALTDVEVKNGPGTFLLPILHKSSYVQTATTLDPVEYQVVTNSLDGKKRVEVGPQLLFLRAYDELDGEKKTAISLKATEFVRLLDCQTGQVRVEAGEQGKVIPGPYEKFVDKEGVRSAIALKCHEYVRIEDKQTGSTRVERGEQLVFLTGHEEIVGKVSKAVEIDEETAVLVRNKREGHLDGGDRGARWRAPVSAARLPRRPRAALLP